MKIVIEENTNMVSITDYSRDTMHVPNWIYQIAMIYREKGWKIYVDLCADTNKGQNSNDVIHLWTEVTNSYLGYSNLYMIRTNDAFAGLPEEV